MLLILQLCSRTWWHLVSTYDSPITALSEGEVPKKEAAVRGEGLVLCTGTECTQEEGLLLRLCFGCRVVVCGCVVPTTRINTSGAMRQYANCKYVPDSID